MSDRKKPSDDLISFGWTMGFPNGASIEIKDDEDQKRFEQFVDKRPEFLAQLIAPRPGTSADASALRLAPDHQTPVQNPIPLDQLIDDHLRSLQEMDQLDSRTIYEKRRAFDNLLAFLEAEHSLQKDAFAHLVTRAMLVSFLESYSHREAKSDTTLRISPGTLAKICGHIAKLFGHAHLKQAASIDVTDGLRTVVKARRGARGSAKSVPYVAFNDTELKNIFDVSRYLNRLNQPDYFWVPLLGLALGTRPGEIVQTGIDQVVQDADSGVWLVSIFAEVNKTDTLRRVPLPQQILDAGFLDYWQKVRSLGAKLLFPFGDFEGPTWHNDPSKNVSRTFGKYLDECGIKHKLKVLYSLRKNSISVLNVLGVPSGDRKLIAGHASDDDEHLGLGSSPRVDVQLKHYIQTDQVSIAGQAPMQRLKQHLDQAAAALPVDWEAFGLAAGIVLDTVRLPPRGATGLRGGWHTNAVATCAEKLEALDLRLGERTTQGK